MTEDLSEAGIVRRIFARYHGQFETLDFTETGCRSQLALDLGFLIGLALRYLPLEEPASAGAVDPVDGNGQKDATRDK